jgi:hypothetical protein
MKTLATAFCLSAAMALSAQGGTIVAAVSATATSTNSPIFDIGNTIDQSGLDTTYISGVTDFDTYIGLDPIHTFLAANNEWFTATGVDTATLTFDLGSSLKLGRIALWNEEFSGFGTGRVSTSTDGTTYSFLGTINPVDSPAGLDYGAQVFSLGMTQARFVSLDVSDCPQPDGNPQILCGLGEIAFESLPTTPIPVPGALPLILGGLGALGYVGRRRATAA